MLLQNVTVVIFHEKKTLGETEGRQKTNEADR